jgi:hypothetical protein
MGRTWRSALRYPAAWRGLPDGDDGTVRGRTRPRDEHPDLGPQPAALLALTALVYVPLIAWYVAAEIGALQGAFAIYHRFDSFMFDLHPVLRELPGGWLVVHACTAAAVTHGALAALTGKPVPIGSRTFEWMNAEQTQRNTMSQTRPPRSRPSTSAGRFIASWVRRPSIGCSRCAASQSSSRVL